MRQAWRGAWHRLVCQSGRLQSYRQFQRPWNDYRNDQGYDAWSKHSRMRFHWKHISFTCSLCRQSRTQMRSIPACRKSGSWKTCTGNVPWSWSILNQWKLRWSPCCHDPACKGKTLVPSQLYQSIQTRRTENHRLWNRTWPWMGISWQDCAACWKCWKHLSYLEGNNRIPQRRIHGWRSNDDWYSSWRCMPYRKCIPR